MNSEYTKSLEEQNEALQKKLAEYERGSIVRVRGLEGEWQDRDHLMLYTCFSILCDFVEQEWEGKVEQYSEEDFKSQTDEEERRMRHDDECRRELYDLYKWWIEEHPKVEKMRPLKSWDIEQKKLLQLFELRKYMWT